MHTECNPFPVDMWADLRTQMGRRRSGRKGGGGGVGREHLDGEFQDTRHAK